MADPNAAPGHPGYCVQATEAAMTDHGYAMHHVPTFAERMWRMLGFRFHYGKEPESFDDLPGWMKTEANMHFGLLDRLRLLLTGRLHISITQHTPVQCDYSKNRLDWQIKAPGDR